MRLVYTFPLTFPIEFADHLISAQEAKSRKPAPKLVLSSGGTSYTYETERIIRIEHGEQETTHQTTVVLSNADGTLKDLDFQGYDAILSHGFVTKEGKEYSTCAPLKVLGQKFDSYPGGLLCTLQLIGIPDLLKQDKASADYEHHWSSEKTVKDLITEVADGHPVQEEITERQDTGNGYIELDDELFEAGQYQKLKEIRTITKISFRLKKTGTPIGNITFHIRDYSSQASLASGVWGNASSLTTTLTWCEATLDTPLEVSEDDEIFICCNFGNGDASNHVDVRYSTADAKINEWVVRGYKVGEPYIETADQDCVYRYKYQYAGIDVYDHCTAYEVVYDSEDSLIDTYLPADSFSIRYGEDRLTVIDKLLYHTNCQRIFKADGKIHVFVPTTTGTTYDSEYSLTSGHPFFSKSLRKGLVSPNRIVVESNPDDEVKYSGSATSAASYALLPLSDFFRTTLESSDQAADMAAAIISRLEIAAQQGGGSVPVNCGAELYDYINVTDERESDSRAGNIGSLNVLYRAERNGQPAEYNMTFGFGRVSLKGVAGTRLSSLIHTRFLKTAADNSIPWEELYALLQEMADNLHDVNVALGWVAGETPADEVVSQALVGYLKNLIEDATPQLGGNLDVNGHSIKEKTGILHLDGKTHVYLEVNGTRVFSGSDTGLDAQLPLSMSEEKISFLAEPTSDQDAATKKYVDDNAGISEVVEDITPQLGGNLDVNGNDVRDLGVTNSVVTASRTLGTSYQNATQYPLLCMVYITYDPSGYCRAYTDSNDPPTTIVGQVGAEAGLGDPIDEPLVFVVRPLDYYKVSVIAGTATKKYWIECQLGNHV